MVDWSSLISFSFRKEASDLVSSSSRKKSSIPWVMEPLSEMLGRRTLAVTPPRSPRRPKLESGTG